MSAPSVAPLTKKPSNSAFKQQRLPAWQPILTAGTVLPAFFVIGIAFIPIGIGLLFFSNNVKEFVYDYTHCQSTNYRFSNQSAMKCADVVLNPNYTDDCICKINFTLNETFEGDVFLYYGLNNFYQNHRRYVKSRDDHQLLGNIPSSVSSDCEPFATNGNKTIIVPCGAIANSLFNDSMILIRKDNNEVVSLHRTGIAWSSDKSHKFRNPAGNLEEVYKNFSKPLNWKKAIWELDPADASNNGLQNEDLIVWMRTAALPHFRKLYRRLNRTQTGYKTGLPAGDYVMSINYAYPVTPFDGSKRFIISTTSLMGGKNPFLGIAYIVVGSICLVLGVVFLFVHIKFGKSTSEMIDVNPRSPYQ